MTNDLAALIPQLFFWGFFALSFAMVILGIRDTLRIRKAWIDARAAGTQYEGEFPNVSMVRDGMKFEMRETHAGKGSPAHVQTYSLSGFEPGKLQSAPGEELLRKVELAKAQGLELRSLDDVLRATVYGLATPDEVRLRLNAFEAVVRALREQV